MSHTIRRVVDIFQFASVKTYPLGNIGLDVEKAFNQVEWRCLTHVLEIFGFASPFWKWIQGYA